MKVYQKIARLLMLNIQKTSSAIGLPVKIHPAKMIIDLIVRSTLIEYFMLMSVEHDLFQCLAKDQSVKK